MLPDWTKRQDQNHPPRHARHDGVSKGNCQLQTALSRSVRAITGPRRALSCTVISLRFFNANKGRPFRPGRLYVAHFIMVHKRGRFPCLCFLFFFTWPRTFTMRSNKTLIRFLLCLSSVPVNNVNHHFTPLLVENRVFPAGSLLSSN